MYKRINIFPYIIIYLKIMNISLAVETILNKITYVLIMEKIAMIHQFLQLNLIIEIVYLIHQIKNLSKFQTITIKKIQFVIQMIVLQINQYLILFVLKEFIQMMKIKIILNVIKQIVETGNIKIYLQINVSLLVTPQQI